MSKDYFARQALSNSGIKRLLISPAHFKYYTDNPPKKTAALRQGNAFHQLILQPKLVDAIRIFDTTKTLESKAGAAFLADNPDSICLTEEEYTEVAQWCEALRANEKTTRLINSCNTEVEIYQTTDTDFGWIDCKAMLDGINDQLIIDLKTTTASAKDFKWESKKYGLDIQAAWYQFLSKKMDGRHRDFYFIVVEKTPPYGVMLYKAGDEFLAGGWEKCEKAIEIYGKSVYSNEWSKYNTDEITTL